MKFDQLRSEVDRVVADTLRSYLGPPWLNPDGGIGSTPRSASHFWSSAQALIIANRARSVPDATINALRNYVTSQQAADGGWQDVVGTTKALTALTAWENSSEVREIADTGIAWLAKAQNHDWGWDVLATQKDAISTAYPTLHAYEAISLWYKESVGPTAAAQQALSNARSWLRSVRKGALICETKDHKYATVRHTAYAVLINESAGDLGLRKAAIERWLKDMQHKDGSWGKDEETSPEVSDVESTAAAIRALLLLGVPPRAKCIRAGVEWLIDQRVRSTNTAGWPTKPNGVPSYLTYYALSALMDFEVAAQNQKHPRTQVRFPRWRRYLTYGLFVVLLAVVAGSVLLVAPPHRALAFLGAAVVAVANIVAAFPVVERWLEKVRGR